MLNSESSRIGVEEELVVKLSRIGRLGAAVVKVERRRTERNARMDAIAGS